MVSLRGPLRTLTEATGWCLSSAPMVSLRKRLVLVLMPSAASSCHWVKSLLENLLEQRGTHCRLQTLKVALTILMQRLTPLPSQSSSSRFFLVIPTGVNRRGGGETSHLEES
jgi:hypothetical protein